jgi:hypothetical protein
MRAFIRTIASLDKRCARGYDYALPSYEALPGASRLARPVGCCSVYDCNL